MRSRVEEQEKHGRRDPTTATPPTGGRQANPEVPAKARRRRFTAEYKRRIVREAAGCTLPGQIGELLRREGLYASHLRTWRRQSATGELAALAPRKRGRKPDPDRQAARELEKQKRENQQLREQLRKAEIIISVQKKLSEILGIDLPSPDEIGRQG